MRPVIPGSVQSEAKAPGRATENKVISMERPDNSDEKDKVLEGKVTGVCWGSRLR